MNIENLHALFCDYALAFKGNTPRTIRWYREIFSGFQKFAQITDLSEFTHKLCEDWVFWSRLEKKLSAQTVKNRMTAMRLFCNFLVERGHLAENYFKTIERPKVPKRIPVHLSKEQALELLQWAKNMPYAFDFERPRATGIIATFIYTGVRLQELINLKVTDIDFDQKILCVHEGKCQKDRIIPMHPKLIIFLEDYLKDRKRLNKTCPYFFTALRNDTALNVRVIRRLFKRIKERSKIHFYPHMLRHTFATLLLEGGCDIYSLSKMLGHSDIKTTTIYLTATTAHLQKQLVKHPLGDF